MQLRDSSSFDFNNTLRVAVRWIFAIGLGVMIFGLVLYNALLIQSPRQQEYREGSMLIITEKVLTGGNPYQAENQPLYTNVYGILYHNLVAPLAKLFGNSFAIHRIVSGIALIAASSFLVWACIKRGTSLLFSLAAGALFYSCQLFNITPLARPDALGLFFFTVSTLLPWAENYNRRSLVLSSIYGSLAFFAKPYFIVSIIFVSLYLFFFDSKKKAWQYLLFSVTFLILGLIFHYRNYPFYFHNTLLSHWEYQSRFAGYMVLQMTYFLLWFSPLIIFVLVTVGRLSWRRPELPTFAFFCSTVLIAISLGQHAGNYMVYLFQLMAPFLLVSSMVVIQRKPELDVLAYLVLALNAILLLYNLFPNGYWLGDEKSEADWQKASKLIEKNRIILNSPALVGEMFHLGVPIVDTGQNQYYYTDSVPDLFFLPSKVLILQRGVDFKTDILLGIKNRVFDRVMLTYDISPSHIQSPWVDRETLKNYYQPDQKLELIMPHTRQKWIIEVWIPSW